MARDAPCTNSFDGTEFSDKGIVLADGSFPKVKARRAFRKVRAQDLAGIWCGCKMCPFIPLMPLSFFPCTKITALDEDNYRTVESGCCLCLPMPPASSAPKRRYDIRTGSPSSSEGQTEGSSSIGWSGSISFALTESAAKRLTYSITQRRAE